MVDWSVTRRRSDEDVAVLGAVMMDWSEGGLMQM